MEIAVAATAVVHGANNVLKVMVVGRHADKELVIRFGLPAIASAFAGAATLSHVAHFDELFRYTIGSLTAVVTQVKLTMGRLIFAFALFELVPALRGLRFDRKHLPLGGILSGFFGGFSGHQGALRFAFLTKVGIPPQSFVGTNALIGFLVDLARIAVYGSSFFLAGTDDAFDRNQWLISWLAVWPPLSVSWSASAICTNSQCRAELEAGVEKKKSDPPGSDCVFEVRKSSQEIGLDRVNPKTLNHTAHSLPLAIFLIIINDSGHHFQCILTG